MLIYRQINPSGSHATQIGAHLHSAPKTFVMSINKNIKSWQTRNFDNMSWLFRHIIRPKYS